MIKKITKVIFLSLLAVIVFACDNTDNGQKEQKVKKQDEALGINKRRRWPPDPRPPRIGDTEIKAIACGAYHSLALDVYGRVWATGKNDHGQLGLGDTDSRLNWEWTGLGNIKAIACGSWHSLALSEDGKVFAAGSNGYGQLGLGDTQIIFNSWTETRLVYDNRPDVVVPIKRIACGGHHSLAIDTADNIWSTGKNWLGQLGLGDNEIRYEWDETGAANMREISCGDDFSLLLAGGPLNGRISGTGLNDDGQLGRDDQNIYNFWCPPSTFSDVKAIACGFYHSLILKTDGRVWATGNNNYGQLALNNSKYDSWTVTGASGIKAMACGRFHSLVLKTNGRVYGAGRNKYGPLALDNNQYDSWTFTGASGIKAIACGAHHSLELSNDGKVFATGRNNHGQLGVGDRDQRNRWTLCE